MSEYAQEWLEKADRDREDLTKEKLEEAIDICLMYKHRYLVSPSDVAINKVFIEYAMDIIPVMAKELLEYWDE